MSLLFLDKSLVGQENILLREDLVKAESDRATNRQYVINWAKKKGVPTWFALAHAKVESGFRHMKDGEILTSSTNNKGLMQLGRGVIKKYKVNVLDANDNARGGVSYMKDLIDSYDGDYLKAANAYFYGRTGLRRKLEKNPNFFADQQKIPRSYTNRMIKAGAKFKFPKVEPAKGIDQGQPLSELPITTPPHPGREALTDVLTGKRTMDERGNVHEWGSKAKAPVVRTPKRSKPLKSEESKAKPPVVKTPKRSKSVKPVAPKLVIPSKSSSSPDISSRQSPRYAPEGQVQKPSVKKNCTVVRGTGVKQHTYYKVCKSSDIESNDLFKSQKFIRTN